MSKKSYAPYKPSQEYTHEWTKLHGYGNLKTIELSDSNKMSENSKKYNRIERPENEKPMPRNCLDMNLTLERLMHVTSYQNM